MRSMLGSVRSSSASAATAKSSPGPPYWSNLVPRDLETSLAGDSQSVDICFDALFEFTEVAECVVGLIGGGVAQAPQEGRVLGMLFHDLWNDQGRRGGRRLGTGRRHGLVDVNGSALDPVHATRVAGDIGAADEHFTRLRQRDRGASAFEDDLALRRELEALAVPLDGDLLRRPAVRMDDEPDQQGLGRVGALEEEGDIPPDRASALHDGAPRAVDDFTDEPALHDVLCDPGRADICRNSARLMKDNARLIVENPGHLVLVDGHTD